MDRLNEFVGVPLSADLSARLVARAKLERRSKAAIVRFALEQYLDKMEERAKEKKNDEM